MSKFSWSYSDFSLALSCLRKYKLLRIDKIVEDAPPSGDLVFGSALHSAINYCLSGNDDAIDYFVSYWETYKDKPLEFSRFGWNDLDRIGSGFIRKFEDRYKSKLKPVIMEKRLYGSYRTVSLEGTMDFIGEYDGVMTLFDWKTTGYPYDKNKSLTALQLYLYAFLCIESAQIVPVQIAYLPFVKSTGSIQTPIILPFKKENMYYALDQLIEYVNLFERQNVYPKNYNECIKGKMVCSMFNVCHKEKE